MKLSNETIAILKNFATINPNIWIEAGNVIKTTEKLTKNIWAAATVKDTFPVDFGIYDLNNFLSVLSLHKDSPELNFDGPNVFVKGLGGRSKVSYRLTAQDMLVLPPKGKTPSLPTVDVTFMLEEDDYIWVTNAAKTLQSPCISVRSDGENFVSLVTFDPKNDSAHVESLEIAGASGCNGTKFDLAFSRENWEKMITGSYEVKISNKGIGHFKSPTLEYYISLEKNATKVG